MKLSDGTRILSTRNAYGEVLLELGAKNDRVVVMDADLAASTMTCRFAKEYPSRFYNMGIAEQNMIGVAAGLATCGMIPIASTFAVFACLRSGEQMRTSVAYPNLNVKVVTTHSGLSIGTAGATHFCEEDLAVFRAIPNITVIAPSDYLQTKKAVAAAVAMHGPVYIRLGRGDAPVLYEELDDFAVGRAATMKDGRDVTLIGTGIMTHRAVAAAALLEKEGVSCRVVDMHTIKPLDEEAVRKAATETRAVVTLEEHNIYGGLGSAVCEVVAKLPGSRAAVATLGIPDVFGDPAPAEELWDAFGMSPEKIAGAAKSLLG